MLQQTPSRSRARARDFQQFCRTITHLPAFAMEGHGETVSFVTNQLDQVQHRRMVVENDRFTFLSEHINDFFALSNRSQRLIDNFEQRKCLSGGVQLTESAVD